jgi:hypothetical protein
MASKLSWETLGIEAERRETAAMSAGRTKEGAMVRALTPQEILEALKTWGIPFKEIKGWRTRSNQGGWGDVTGFVVHHTGIGDAPDAIELKVLVTGSASLSGPLANFGLDDDGVVHLVAAGAANHAGGGDQRVLKAVQLESYDQRPPPPRFTHDEFLAGVPGSVIGNPRFMGVETCYENNLTSKARAMMPRLAAAVIWALDRKDTDNQWSARSVIGHKEWQRGKPDPAGVDMTDLRSEIQTLLNRGPGGPGLLHLPERSWFLVPNIPRDNLEQIRTTVWTQPAAQGPGAPTMWRMLTTMAAQVASLQAAVAELAKNPQLSAEELRTITREAAARAIQNVIDPADDAQDELPAPPPPQPKGRRGTVPMPDDMGIGPVQ